MADIRDDDRLFSAVIDVPDIETTEENVVLVRNPSGSNRTMIIKKLVFSNISTVTSFIRFRIYAAPTVTADGTAVSTVALDRGSGNTSSMEIFTVPTTSASGTPALCYGIPTSQGGGPAIDDFPSGFQLRPNQSLLIRALSDGTANRDVCMTIIWEEN